MSESRKILSSDNCWRAIDARLLLRRQRCRVIVTHFGLRAKERRLQARKLLRLASQPSPGPLVVLGDFNEWSPWSRPLRWLRSQLEAKPAPRTYPTRFPLLALDRIWVRPAECLLELSAHDTPLARRASDHLPLKATVAFP
jgi:endonuclease/exonuclease/phosphatase family metal-dependent hydrolase